MPPIKRCEVCERPGATFFSDLDMVLCPRCQAVARPVYEAQVDLRERIEGKINNWALAWRARGLELPTLLECLESMIDDLSQEWRASCNSEPPMGSS